MLQVLLPLSSLRVISLLNELLTHIKLINSYPPSLERSALWYIFSPNQNQLTSKMSNVLAQKTRDNLLHYCLWTGVTQVALPSSPILIGTPPEPIHPQPASASGEEYVYPVSLDARITPAELDSLFRDIGNILGTPRPKRIVLAVCSDDGTIVYYIVHDGITKPKKN